MYADDTCIIASSPSALQRLLNICVAFAHSNFVLFNEKKTKCMCFKPKSLANLHIPKIYLNEVPLTFATSCKYLGIVISNGMRDVDDIMRHVRSLYTRGNMLISRFKTCSHEVKVKLFKIISE